jgi:hypothetical protein
VSRLAPFASIALALLALGACGGADPISGAADTATAADTAAVDTATPDVAADTVTPDAAAADAADVADEANEQDTTPLDTSDDGASPDGGADTSGLPPCDPPLAVTPSQAWTPPRHLVTLVAHGGVVEYRFSWVTNASGAVLNGTSGAYLSGSTAGATDVVRVTDLGCAGEALATITVTPPLAILPLAASVPPATGAVSFASTGGSGDTAYSMLVAATGATVSADGHYQAGAVEGVDRVRVTDLETGEVADADVAVVVGAQLRLDPARLFLPVGARYALTVAGGSGHADVAISGDAVTYEAGWLTAVHAGEDTVTLSDPYTGLTTATTVTAVASPAVPSVAAGDSNWTAYVRTPGDLDGDGYPDAVVTVNEVDVDAWDSGGLFVYAGTADGLDPVPARVISGADRQDHLGRGVAFGDVDQDGLTDLVVSAHDSDLGGTNSGAVLLFPGRAGGFFAEAPSKTLVGLSSGDAHGHSLALCDFNGDGSLDLAAGARFGEDRNQSPVISNTGAVRVYLGGPSGWLPSPDVAVFGRLPDGQGGWAHTADMNLGWEVAAGDVDGDGYCDLVAAGVQLATGPGRSQDGAVAIFRGRGPDALSPGGVTEVPVLLMLGDEPDSPQSRLGWSIAVGDVTGDGKAEVVIGQPYYRLGTANQNGAVRIIRGGPLPDGPAAATIGPDDADWSWYGGAAANGGDYFGWSVAIGDADGVGPLDVLVGDLQDEAPGGPSNTGTVHVLAGRDGELPDAVSLRVFGGDQGGQRFGVAAAPYPDVDGDGQPELVVRAAFDSNEGGPRIGRTYLAPSTPDAALTPLETPAHPAGAELGVGLALLPDVTGDGLPELAIGGPRAQADPNPARIRPGVVSVHAGQGDGFAPAPLSVINGFAGHSTDDRFGDDLAVLADFDGDAAPELAVVASTDDTGNACAPSRSNPGAVHLFRLGAGGVAADPALTYYGEQANQQLHHVAGADVDGDGLTDLFVTSRFVDGPDAAGDGRNVGGGALVLGRALPAEAPVTVVCAADWTFTGAVRDAQLGTAVTALGDVDGDGCDDVAVGAGLDDAPGNASGSVYLLLGWGAGCAAASPRAVRLSALTANSQVGQSLAGRVDVDDDGVPDLVVGGPQFRDGANAIGAAWLVPGTWLATAAEQAVPWVDGEPPPIVALLPTDNDRTLRIEGRLTGEQLGAAVALVAPSAGGYGAIAVGRPLADLAGVTGAGAVSIYAIGPDGILAAPIAGLGGETRRPRSEPGVSLTAGLLGGVPVVVVGARRASAFGLDDGAAYPLVLTPTP